MKFHQNLSHLNPSDLARTIRPGLRFTPMAAAIAASLFSLVPNAASAATLNVGVNGCTLANAINNANGDTDVDGGSGCIAGHGADTLNLPASSVQTLTAVLLDVTSEITIEGHGATVRRSVTAPFRIFTVTLTGNLSLNQTTVRGGSIEGPIPTGGDPSGCGGGILNYGILKLNRSTLSGNTASFGGGLCNYHGTATLIDSTVLGNRASTTGGGIQGLLGTLELIRSTVSGNQQTGTGAEGGVGGVGAILGTLTLTDSTVSANTAKAAAGVFSVLADVKISNSTISGNVASEPGGGIFSVLGSLVLTDSTVSGNSASVGGGLYLYGPDATISRSLISGNASSASYAPELFFEPINGSITADDHNLFGFNSDPGVVGFTAGGTDVVPGAPLSAILAPLANNGGPTRTHLLARNSPAIDAAGTGCPAADQRGMARPQGAACDIGAVEVIDPVTHLTLTPPTASHLTLEMQCVTVTAENAAGEGAADVAVSFTRTGANPGMQSLATNALGQAQSCWIGVNGGVDHVTATFEELVSNESLITWNKRVTNITPAAVVGVFVPSQHLIHIAPKATLKDSNGNVPIAGRTVQFSAGSAPLCAAVTNATGVATCNASLSSTLQSILALGYTAKFAGDTSYQPVQKKSPLVTIKLGL